MYDDGEGDDNDFPFYSEGLADIKGSLAPIYVALRSNGAERTLVVV